MHTRVLLYLTVATSLFLLPVAQVDAQMLTGDWREKFDDIPDEVERERSDDERSEDDDSDDRSSRTSSGLSKDIVKSIPIPILFGVTLDEITPNFGAPRDGGARKHEGLDLLVLEGTPVVSPTDAVVRYVGNGVSSGHMVSTENPGGEQFRYMHLRNIGDIKRGDRLKAGDLIGYVGDTGNAKGGPPHLHFEIRKGGTARDPYFRVTEEFSGEEKLAFLDDILEEQLSSRHADILARWLAYYYRGELLAAERVGGEMPGRIAAHLPEQRTLVRTTETEKAAKPLAASSDVSVEAVVRLLLSLGIIPPEKAERALLAATQFVNN